MIPDNMQSRFPTLDYQPPQRLSHTRNYGWFVGLASALICCVTAAVVALQLLFLNSGSIRVAIVFIVISAWTGLISLVFTPLAIVLIAGTVRKPAEVAVQTLPLPDGDRLIAVRRELGDGHRLGNHAILIHPSDFRDIIGQNNHSRAKEGLTLIPNPRN
jgi:hypothetical protein